MKKSLLLLPLAASLLAGCMPGGGGKKSSGGGGQPSVAPGGEVTLGPEEYQGYRRVMTAPENDKEYIYGIYQCNLQKNIFMNGHHHTDDQGEYPYYLTTTTEVSKAVKIKCHYVDTTHFTIQITGGGEFKTYDGKYLELYEGEKDDGTKIISLRAGDNQAKWYFMESYTYGADTTEIKTNVMDVEETGYGAQPCSMGTYEEYETFSATTPNRFAGNFISHLWEKS